jgi:glycerate 2-kinase
MADLKQLARRIFQKTLAAIDIPAAMLRKVRREGSLLHCGAATVDLGAFDRVCLVAIGKAAPAMTEGLFAALGRDAALEGVVAAPTAPTHVLPGIRYFVGGHPLPNEDSWKAAEQILALLRTCNEKTLVFFLLSGGGSRFLVLRYYTLQTRGDLN